MAEAARLLRIPKAQGEHYGSKGEDRHEAAQEIVPMIPESAGVEFLATTSESPRRTQLAWVLDAGSLSREVGGSIPGQVGSRSRSYGILY